MMLNSKSLRFIRTAAGIEQAELAKEAGVSPSTVSLIEKGSRQLTAETEKKLIQALGISEELMFKLLDVMVEVKKERMGC